MFSAMFEPYISIHTYVHIHIGQLHNVYMNNRYEL